MTAHPAANGTTGADAGTERADLADHLAGQRPLDVEAALWAARQQDGLDPDELAELQAWLARDPAHGARLSELEGVLGRVDELPPETKAALRATVQQPPAAPCDAGAAGTRHRAALPDRPGRRGWLQSWSRLVPAMAMAGFAAVVVGGGWLGWRQWEQQPTYSQRFATLRGQQIEATLPDGSRLRLDTSTRVEATLYRQQRVMQLPQGQAMFEVQADAQRPFHVLAGPMRITVLGTRFSVRHTQEGGGAGHVQVVVEEGRVRVARATGQAGSHQEPAREAAQAVVLTAGQVLEAAADGRILAVRPASMQTSLAWREGRVVLNDTPLGDAVAEFERYVDTGLVVLDPAVAAMRLNGSFDLRQASAFRRALPQVLPVRLLSRADGKAEVAALP